MDLFQHLEKPPGDRFHKALTITRLSTTLLPILWKCCETGCGMCGFTHSTPLKYRKQESVTPPCYVPGWLHYPAKICVVFAGLSNCHGICSAKKLLLPSGLQIKLCLLHSKKHAPNPKRGLHADLLRSMTRASVLSGDGSSNPEMLSLQYPKFLVHGSKDIQRLQDASGMMQHYHRFYLTAIVSKISPQKNLNSEFFDPPSPRPALGAVRACQSPPSQKLVADVVGGDKFNLQLTSRKPFISLIQPEVWRCRQFGVHE